ncbi:MAG: EamA family transporter [Candidatus Muiribacteriota bacterium]
MNWIILSLLTALSRSLTDIFTKKSGEKTDFLIIAWATNFFALPVLLPIVIAQGIPELNTSFFVTLLFSGLLNGIVAVLYVRALQESDISLAIPMVAFSPLLVFITTPILVNEYPSKLGAVGILLIVAGSYIANLKRKTGIFEPFKSLYRNKGTKMMLAVALIWSITSNLDKIGLTNSSPVFWGFSVYFFISILLFRPAFFKTLRNINTSKKNLLLTGIFNGLTILFQMQALTLTIVPYVIAIKRTSVIISVIAGFLIFKENSRLKRLSGAILMFLGILFIILKP